MIRTTYKSIKGGTNNLCTITAQSPLISKGIAFFASSERGEKQALNNLRRQVRKFIIIEEASDGLQLSKRMLKYQTNKYMKCLGD